MPSLLAKEGRFVVGNRRPVRRSPQRTQPTVSSDHRLPPARPELPVQDPGEDDLDLHRDWSPPTPRAVSRLGSEQRVALERIGHVSGEAQRAAADLAASVLAGRAQGLSWSVIGHAVGTTGEGARQRWGSR